MIGAASDVDIPRGMLITSSAVSAKSSRAMVAGDWIVATP